MKLNNEDKRRLEEIFWMQGISCWAGMSFDEMAEQRCYSVAATRKIRGTYNKIQKIATEWDIDRYDVIEYVKGNIYNAATLLLFLLMNCRNTQMRSGDLSQLIYEATGNIVYSYGLKPMLFGLDAMTQCDPISYTDTNCLDNFSIGAQSTLKNQIEKYADDIIKEANLIEEATREDGASTEITSNIVLRAIRKNKINHSKKSNKELIAIKTVSALSLLVTGFLFDSNGYQDNTAKLIFFIISLIIASASTVLQFVLEDKE